MRTYGRRRARETPEEREARLQQTSDDRRDLREARLEHELFDQNSVRSKMSKFHADLASIEVSRCTTCSEGFLGLRLHSHECQRCSRDKHIPKLYSSANNMDPGPVPPQLQVSLRSSLL